MTVSTGANNPTDRELKFLNDVDLVRKTAHPLWNNARMRRRKRAVGRFGKGVAAVDAVAPTSAPGKGPIPRSN